VSLPLIDDGRLHTDVLRGLGGAPTECGDVDRIPRLLLIDNRERAWSQPVYLSNPEPAVERVRDGAVVTQLAGDA
jgi:hypothetical protein